MAVSGGCYCGALRYELTGAVQMRGLCLCRTCQKISGGAGNLFLGIAANAFSYTRGKPREFTLAAGLPTREFCAECGVHIAARSPKAPGGLVVKAGTLDDPAELGGPTMAFWCSEKQSHHVLPEGVLAYSSLPGR